ncbi:MAG: GNAT family N-acetyltransferase, partial [Oscillospiraceae bacterium]|nr:GNAT family N-acetyltransferase [Oscillospiraceae bacterium]
MNKINNELNYTDFCKERGIGYCGLACVVCVNRDDKDCPGCIGKTANGEGCDISKCVVEKGIDGCYACPECPCDKDMLKNKRIKAFNRYISDFGKEALLDRLHINFKNSITYHKPDKTPGDYDILETEDDVYQLLRYGRNDPYAICPEYETKHLKFRLVRLEDAQELLDSFYNDLSKWMFYGNDMCKKIFAGQYATLDEMKNCIRIWLNEYKNKYFIRFSVLDKSTGKFIGTIEVFDNFDKQKRGAALHIDFAASYETQIYISELLSLADKEFFRTFGFISLFIRADPNANERITALLE